jgi:GNAT superfamily N-acetyltransferase
LTPNVVPELEAAAFAAWPAEHVLDIGGWRVRWMSGVTRRGNSAWTNESTDAGPLERRIAAVERFYGDRGLAPSFHLSPLTTPANLDDSLTERGYTVDVKVAVQTVATQAMLEKLSKGAENIGKCREAALAVEVRTELTEDWFAVAGARSRFRQHQPVYRRLLTRLQRGAVYATAFVAGAPAATAVGVAHPPWLGIHSMLTQPEFRGRGLSKALLSGLARHAQAQQLVGVYLQVEDGNHAARRAYHAAGFQTAYATHYRTLVSPAARADHRA